MSWTDILPADKQRALMAILKRKGFIRLPEAQGCEMPVPEEFGNPVKPPDALHDSWRNYTFQYEQADTPITIDLDDPLTGQQKAPDVQSE